MLQPVFNAYVTHREQAGRRLLVLGFRCDQGPLQFTPGQFVNVGLPGADGTWVTRAYSVASAPGAELTEVVLTLVDGGALTPRLFSLQPSARLYVERAPAGNFTLRDVPSAAPLLVVATGTGTAPFASMLRAGLWDGRRVWVVHGSRWADGLAFATLFGQADGVTYLPVVSQDPAWTGQTGRVQAVLDGLVDLPADTHAMLCGNPQMIADVRVLLEARGFKKHRKRDPGNLHFEAYWSK